MNYRIRRAIEGYIQANGQQDTRDVIALFAKRFNTTKQRIKRRAVYTYKKED